MDEEAASLEQAMRVMEEWERAEPGFRRKSDREVEVQWTAMDRKFEREQTAREAARQEQLLRYDKERAEARLALLEAESVLDHKLRELAQFKSGEAFPRMAHQQRGARVMELEQAIATRRAQVKSLRPVVGDPEDVPDSSGHLPADRRVSSLYSYRERRIHDVKKLRVQLPDLDAAIKGTDDRAERSKLRAERDIKRYQLDKLLAVPRLDAKDMCPDCPTPSSEHGQAPGSGVALRDR